MTIMAGGFGLCGIPEHLIDALKDADPRNLTVIGNNVGCDGHGMWKVLAHGQIRKVIASYVGENKLLELSYMRGEIEIEFNPQGTLAERIRAGGTGIPAFVTPTGYGTTVAEGKECREFNGKWFVMETGPDCIWRFGVNLGLWSMARRPARLAKDNAQLGQGLAGQ